MATRNAPSVSEIERLQDENRDLREHLTTLENELGRKDENIHENTKQIDDLSSELKKSKRDRDHLQDQLEEAKEEVLHIKGKLYKF